MTALRLLLALAVAFASTLASAQAGHPRPIESGQVVGDDLLNARVPDSPGWLVLESSGRITLGRRGATNRESYVVQLSLFELPELDGRDAFVAFVRGETERDMPPERFAEPSASYAYTEERGYACVKYTAFAIDLKTPGGPLKLGIHALYCGHPTLAERGFAAVYSQRAAEMDADLGAQAEEFLSSVRVPEKKRKKR